PETATITSFTFRPALAAAVPGCTSPTTAPGPSSARPMPRKPPVAAGPGRGPLAPGTFRVATPTTPTAAGSASMPTLATQLPTAAALLSFQRTGVSPVTSALSSARLYAGCLATTRTSFVVLPLRNV